MAGIAGLVVYAVLYIWSNKLYSQESLLTIFTFPAALTLSRYRHVSRILRRSIA